MKPKQRVLIMRCDEYDPDRISGIIKEGMEELGVKPSGNILLKPNVVIAHAKYFPYAFTRKEFLDGAISATKEMAENVKEISVGERSGITVPTRYNFAEAGYPKVIKKHKIKLHYFDESKHVPVKLKGKYRLRDQIFLPKPIVQCDFLINLPKFKAHPWSRMTLSNKNFIGIQDDRHRLVDHSIFLEYKIADLQEVIQPKFIAIDAITAGQKMMLTPTPFDMGAIVMGTNSCAVDTVCCHMVHVNPNDVIHLKFASERGFGPKELEKIDISGNFPLEEVQQKTRNFEICMEHIDDYFGEDGNLSCTVGTFPAEHSPDYCWGGCPGALQEAMHVIRNILPDADADMRKVRFVVGKVEEPLDLEEGEKVLFVGDCTSWKGKIDGKDVNIESSFKYPSEVDETKTKSNDSALKLITAQWNCFWKKRSPYMHIKGCTVSVTDIIHYLSAMGKIKNASLLPELFFHNFYYYNIMKINRFLNRFLR